MVAPTIRAEPYSPRPIRLALLYAVLCLFAVGITARLTYWQVVQAAPLQKRLSAQHTLDEQVPARRGAIRDTNGDLLAGNLSVDFIYADTRQIKEPNDVANRLAAALGVAPDRLLPSLSTRDRPYVRLLGGKKFDPEESQKVAQLRIPGVFLEPTTKRVYPEQQLAAHVLGFVDGDSKGWYGLEGQYQDVVGGQPGHLRAEKDTAGNEIGFSDRQWRPPQDGLDLVLTIDRTIQYIAERELDRAVVQHRASGGTVIVMRPRTGEILAMASRPAFDPNRYEEFASQTALFANPAITHAYEPGSTFKIFTMAGALNEKVVTPETTYTDTGGFPVGGYVLRNWDGRANGVTTMVQLLEKSSNVGAATVAFRLGKQRFYRYVSTFGFGQPTGIDLQGEATGIVKDPNSRDWGEVDLATNAFGQAISITPIQLITAAAAVANGGIMMRPYVVKQVVDPRTGKKVQVTQQQIVRQVVSRETAATLLKMLNSAAENGETRGALVPGYHVAGKTGTASIPVNGGYDTNLTIASFVGMVPADDPQFVVLVKIDRPQDEPWGSLIAKPAFAIIAQELTRFLKIPPDPNYRPPAATPVPAAPTPAAPPARAAAPQANKPPAAPAAAVPAPANSAPPAPRAATAR
ncbi:MAG: penicillin-binding protein 2 [Chloroflexi bacterium]|nr:penicillin-binding protein 2 [Chloroflexota bacterium]